MDKCNLSECKQNFTSFCEKSIDDTEEIIYIYLVNETTTTNKEVQTMEKMIEILTNNGLSHEAAEIMANDINTCLGLMELTGSLKPEAVIGFYYDAKERGLDSNYVKTVITIAQKLYENHH